MNLKESVRQWVLRNLPYDPGNADLTAHLNGLDAYRLLVVYFNWMNRRLQLPQPRRVRKSRAFEQNPIVALRKLDIDQIIADIEVSRDLKKYLSKDIEIPVQVPGKSKGRRRDLDLMLNDWGVHHHRLKRTVLSSEADHFYLLFSNHRQRILSTLWGTGIGPEITSFKCWLPNGPTKASSMK